MTFEDQKGARGGNPESDAGLHSRNSLVSEYDSFSFQGHRASNQFILIGIFPRRLPENSNFVQNQGILEKNNHRHILDILRIIFFSITKSLGR